MVQLSLAIEGLKRATTYSNEQEHAGTQEQRKSI